MSIMYGSFVGARWFDELDAADEVEDDDDDDEDDGAGSIQSMSRRWRLNDIGCLFPSLWEKKILINWLYLSEIL